MNPVMVSPSNHDRSSFDMLRMTQKTNLTSVSDIRALAARQGITLTRLRGQHFLIDKGPLAAVAESADLKKSDTVLEVGPGFGTLTGILAPRVGRVVAVELDKRFLPVLRETVGEFSNVQIIHGDILIVGTRDWGLGTRYKIVSNLPYGISSDFLWRTMAEWDPAPERLVLMLQREVGERLTAAPPRMNLLAVMAQSFGTVEIIRRVSRGSFLPPPAVDSAIVRIIRRPEVDARRAVALRLAKIGFSSPRKKLAGTLAHGLHSPLAEISDFLARSGLDPGVRPEVLGVEHWVKLSQFI